MGEQCSSRCRCALGGSRGRAGQSCFLRGKSKPCQDSLELTALDSLQPVRSHTQTGHPASGFYLSLQPLRTHREFRTCGKGGTQIRGTFKTQVRHSPSSRTPRSHVKGHGELWVSFLETFEAVHGLKNC